MSKTWMIIKHEYLTNIKRRSFLFGAFVVPLISILLIGVVFGVAINSETDVTRVGTVGYVDESGVLAAQLDEPDYFHAYESGDAASAALDDGSIGAYFVVTQNYMDTGIIRLLSKSGVPEALKGDINAFMLANLSTGLDPDVAARLKNPIMQSIKALDTGRVIRDNAIASLFIMPIIFVMVFMIASQTTSGYLMSGVVEEKTSHIMELLVTSVTPFQMMFGKIIGLGLLGLTQLAVWIAAGYITLALGNNTSFLTGVTIPLDLLVVGVIYFLLGYFLLACVMAAIGVVVGSEQESRQFAGIFGIILAIPFFLISSFITDPNGGVVVFLTLFPFTSPVSMIMRMGFSAVPAWQLILSIVLLLVSALFMAWASARIFRWALLLYGKRPGLRQLIRVIRRPAGMATSATGENAG